jgi:DNA-binding MarR family transcriptional regulator
MKAVAECRFLIERYLKQANDAARSAGLESQQYQGLLAVGSLHDGGRATIGELADRMQIVHHSAVELTDRMERRGLIRRERSGGDHRRVFLVVTPLGRKLLRRLASNRVAEIREAAPSLIHALKIAISSVPQQKLPRNHRSRTRSD